MTTSRELRSKHKMIDVIRRMPEDGTIDDAIYRLNLLKAVAQGLEAVEEGRVYDHDEVFDELLKDDTETSSLERTGKNGASRTKGSDRKDGAKRGSRVRSKVKRGRR